ncbi:glycosyltransferase [Peribacillus frigoritolerans]|uniref:glycosyltransferase n=1 Tax=Peribacillus frigoritolerans TaxID=450367 RepID=UPI0025A2C5D1|nr:glycosyltransferase [Peribacillus frigoritolerans]MDM5313197.1 glycosyltransferase [Peribacillus frigoritolerans]
MEKKINLIITPQEYNQANHNELWNEISEKSDGITIILNIGADFFISLARGKFFRVKEAINGPKILKKNLILLRPFYILRPEISNNIVNSFNTKLLKQSLKKIVKNIEEYQINVLYYDGIWPTFLDQLKLNTKYYYYIMDEVRNDAHNNKTNLKRTRHDKIACEKSDYIYLMSTKLIEKRREYLHKLKVIGNGASQKEYDLNVKKLNNSVGVIGNIRNWIDCDLLTRLIEKRQDIHFGFVGNIESDMQKYMDEILTKYKNVKYYGEVSKGEVHNWYKKFDVILVPYKQNEFMKATRPIKIVESIFASTPVVSIPITGYEECSFIRFAKNVKEFSSEIDYLTKNKINIESREYQDFIKLNSWSYKAEEILNEFK